MTLASPIKIKEKLVNKSLIRPELFSNIRVVKHEKLSDENKFITKGSAVFYICHIIGQQGNFVTKHW